MVKKDWRDFKIAFWVLFPLVLAWYVFLFSQPAHGAAFRWYESIKLSETADSARAIFVFNFDSTATSKGTSLDSLYWKYLTNDTAPNEITQLVYWSGYTQPQSYYSALYNTWYSTGDTVDWILRVAWADSPDSVIQRIVTNWTDTTFDTATAVSSWYDTISLTDTSTCLVTYHTLIGGDWSSVTYTFPKATNWHDCVGDPSDSNFCTVYGTVALHGDSATYAEVIFTLPNTAKINTCDSTFLLREQVITYTEPASRSHHHGYFAVDLLRSSCLNDGKYKMEIRIDGYKTLTKTITVPDSTSYKVWP